MTVQECPQPSLLELVHAGKLSPTELNTVESHLETCEKCSDYLNTIWKSSHKPRLARDETIPVPLWVKSWAEHGPPRQLPRLKKPIVEGDLGSLGKYRLLNSLGNGTSSVVYHGFDTVLHRNVTIKAYRPGYIRNGINEKAAVDEARAMAQFDNNRVLGIIDIGKDGPTDFLVFPHTNGTCLSVLLKSAGFNGLQRSTLLTLAHDITMGLRTIHEHGLCHRDLKPGNILAYVAEDGKIRARLIDLGLSKCPDSKAGTEGYLAPEVKKGFPPTPAGDLYSLGWVLNAMALVSDQKWPRDLRIVVNNLRKHDPTLRPSIATVLSVLEKHQAPRNAIATTAILFVIGLMVTITFFVFWYIIPK